jgi:hypothetical protein
MLIFMFRSFEQPWAIYRGAVEVLRMDWVRVAEVVEK